MKEIPLNHGKIALVDDEDFDYLSHWHWYAHKESDDVYRVHASQKVDGVQRTFVMARVIMNTPKGVKCDHIDHNPLNNQKSNLRNATSSQNTMNSLIRSDNKLGMKNISPCNKRSFRVQIYKNGKHIFDKSFTDLEKAQKARDRALVKYHGEFACNGKLEEA